MRYLISTHPQGTPEWHQDRLGKVTGSAVDAVFSTVKSGEAAARADYRTQLVRERINKKPQPRGYISKDMAWGTETEPMARMAYEAERGIAVEESGFLYLPDIAAGCSVDGLFTEGGRRGFWEAKCPKPKTHWKYLMDGKLPEAYRPQVTHNFWITGADFAEFASYDPDLPDELQLVIVRVERDEAAINAHAAAVLQFLKEVERDEREVLQVLAKKRSERVAVPA